MSYFNYKYNGAFIVLHIHIFNRKKMIIFAKMTDSILYLKGDNHV